MQQLRTSLSEEALAGAMGLESALLQGELLSTCSGLGAVLRHSHEVGMYKTFLKTQF